MDLVDSSRNDDHVNQTLSILLIGNVLFSVRQLYLFMSNSIFRFCSEANMGPGSGNRHR